MSNGETSGKQRGRSEETREQRAWNALEILGREQFIAFVRAIRDESRLTAVRLANEALDEGQTVDQLFFTGDVYGFQLNVTRRSHYEHAPGREPPFREVETLVIDFGCLAGGTAGDGGQWTVALTRDGMLDRVLEQGRGWIA